VGVTTVTVTILSLFRSGRRRLCRAFVAWKLRRSFSRQDDASPGSSAMCSSVLGRKRARRCPSSLRERQKNLRRRKRDDLWHFLERVRIVGSMSCRITEILGYQTQSTQTD
jgi:hypothetical protein